MNRVCLAFFTKERVDLSGRTIEPLLGLPADIKWCDGSTTEAGKQFPHEIQMGAGHRHNIVVHHDVRGGPDAAVAFALTSMLEGTDYDYVGLVENDVLLPAGWFEATMALFDKGREDGLCVGAASARCYEDRVLIQRDGYAVMHNLGWGQQIMTREAARLALANMRTSITTENRRLFCQLSGLDIGAWWAFRASDSNLCADWGNDRMLASHGLASLALTPSGVEMIGQDPPLAQQGLSIKKSDGGWCSEDAFALYRDRTAAIRDRGWSAGCVVPELFCPATGTFTIFAHQVPLFGGKYEGDWRLHFEQGFGPFAWKADPGSRDYDPEGYAWHNGVPTLTIPLSGPVEFLVSASPDGGRVLVEDMYSGFSVSPVLPPGDLVSITVPSSVSYRELRLTALSKGVVFRAIRTREPQPFRCDWEFDWHSLPPA